jgi:hypothetical protein
MIAAAVALARLVGLVAVLGLVAPEVRALSFSPLAGRGAG